MWSTWHSSWHILSNKCYLLYGRFSHAQTLICKPFSFSILIVFFYNNLIFVASPFSALWQKLSQSLQLLPPIHRADRMLKGSGGSKPAAGVLGTRKWMQLVLAQHPHNDICWHNHMSVRRSVIQPLGHPWALFIPTSRPHDPQLSQPLRPPWHMTKPVPFSKQQLWDVRWAA